MTSESEILTWLPEVTQECVAVEGVRQVFNETLNADNGVASVTSIVCPQVAYLEQLCQVYSHRSVLLSSYFDSAQKASTLVAGNYEKLEECIDTMRSDVRDLLKKLYSYTTLEMDYCGKVMDSIEKAHACTAMCVSTSLGLTCELKTASVKACVQYKDILDKIYHHDQIHIFRMTVNDMVTDILTVLQKFKTILSNRDNIDEIKKLWHPDVNPYSE